MHARLEHCPSVGLPTLQATLFLMPWATCELVGTSGQQVSCKNPSESITCTNCKKEWWQNCDKTQRISAI